VSYPGCKTHISVVCEFNAYVIDDMTFNSPVPARVAC